MKHNNFVFNVLNLNMECLKDILIDRAKESYSVSLKIPRARQGPLPMQRLVTWSKPFILT